MNKLDMDDLVRKIVDSGMATMDELSGFEESDVKELETRHQVTLPATYKEFLLSIGYSSDRVFRFLFMYPGLDKYRNDAYEMANKCNIQIPEGAFVFLIDDTQFFYFNSKSGDDPEVYKYMEGDEAPKKVFDHFSDWLTNFVTGESELERQYPGTKS